MSRAGSGGQLFTETVGDVVCIDGVWLGGGSASNCTRVSGTGIDSVNYNSATGRYLITLTGRYQVLEAQCYSVAAATGAATSFMARPVVGGYSASAGTLDINVTDLATPTNHDLAATEQIWISLKLRAEGVYT